MNTKKFYYTIPSHNIRDYVEAYSHVDAKARAYKEYSELWNEIIWEDTSYPNSDVDTSEIKERCARLFF